MLPKLLDGLLCGYACSLIFIIKKISYTIYRISFLLLLLIYLFLLGKYHMLEEYYGQNTHYKAVADKGTKH